MKKSMYLFVAGTMFAFTACGGGEAATEETAVEEVVVEEVAAEEVIEDTTAVAAGCQVEGGACLADHSCCLPKADATEAHEEDTQE